MPSFEGVLTFQDARRQFKTLAFWFPPNVMASECLVSYIQWLFLCIFWNLISLIGREKGPSFQTAFKASFLGLLKDAWAQNKQRDSGASEHLWLRNLTHAFRIFDFRSIRTFRSLELFGLFIKAFLKPFCNSKQTYFRLLWWKRNSLYYTEREWRQHKKSFK